MINLEKILKELKPIETPPQSAHFNLGVLIGEYIISHNLPTLDLDIFKTKNVISTSEDEKIEYNRLNILCFNDKNETPENKFDELKNYYKSLIRKYFPNELICDIPISLDLNDNINEVKNGIRDSLWNSDVCEYNIEIENIDLKTNLGFLLVTLKLDKGTLVQISFDDNSKFMEIWDSDNAKNSVGEHEDTYNGNFYYVEIIREATDEDFKNYKRKTKE